MEHGILLEAGTNELELLTFKLGNTSFGINVAKVREIIQPGRTIVVPYMPHAVDGAIRVREEILTLVNLGRHFGMENQSLDTDERITIIVEFSSARCAILVDEVQRIHRLSWDHIQAPSQHLLNVQAPITGTVIIEDQVILIADFETIVGEILGIESVRITDDVPEVDANRAKARLLIAEDSSFVRAALVNRLQQHGYENLVVCTDGQQAWDTLADHCDDAEKRCDLVLSDIEMPRMDGLHLTARIKKDPKLKHIPVILFSSLITADNRKKGIAVGADAQVSKPDGEEMIQAIETHLKKVKSASLSPA